MFGTLCMRDVFFPACGGWRGIMAAQDHVRGRDIPAAAESKRQNQHTSQIQVFCILCRTFVNSVCCAVWQHKIMYEVEKFQQLQQEKGFQEKRCAEQRQLLINTHER
jgi:hypothetical protein